VSKSDDRLTDRCRVSWYKQNQAGFREWD